MPLGIERINARQRQPNERIVFIKPLEGPDKAIAQDFLERVAAIVFPIMRSNHLNVMSLEEFPPNMEFWGRNFNAGEVIQLVLKHPRTHTWLSFEQVQYTMIHELAHILQMNHSTAFWSVRNKFANELHALHVKGYTGEGFWSAGRALNSNQPFLHSRPLSENELPQSLCGGTYRNHRRQQTPQVSAPKRKITYAERQQRRKERKFGPGEGERLGGYATERVKLEQGKGRTVEKAPKIASSKRSRDLRAAAALKRFETGKKDDAGEKFKSEDEESTASEWDDEGWEYDPEDEKDAVDVGNGKKLVPVSGKEDTGDQEARNRKFMELRGCATIGGEGSGLYKSGKKSDDKRGNSHPTAGPSRQEPQNTTLDNFLWKTDTGTRKTSSPLIIEIDDSDDSVTEISTNKRITKNGGSTKKENQTPKTKPSSSHGTNKALDLCPSQETSTSSNSLCCVACSSINPPISLTCFVCANVLDPAAYQGSWKCRSGGEYWNSPDCGRCAVCGEAR